MKRTGPRVGKKQRAHLQRVNPARPLNHHPRHPHHHQAQPPQTQGPRQKPPPDAGSIISLTHLPYLIDGKEGETKSETGQARERSRDATGIPTPIDIPTPPHWHSRVNGNPGESLGASGRSVHREGFPGFPPSREGQRGQGRIERGKEGKGEGSGCYWHFGFPLRVRLPPLSFPPACLLSFPPAAPCHSCWLPLSFLLAALCHSRWLPSVIPAVFSGNPVEGARTPGPPHPCPLPPGEREEEGRGERKGEGTPEGEGEGKGSAGRGEATDRLFL